MSQAPQKERSQEAARDSKMLYAFSVSLNSSNPGQTVDSVAFDSFGEIYSRLVLAQGLLPVAGDSK